MMNTDHISKLLDRFFEAQTTLAEERQLYSYFRSDNVAAEHLPLRDLFLDMAACNPESSLPGHDAQPVRSNMKEVSLPGRRRIWSAAAAIIVATLVIAGISIETQAREMARFRAQFEGSYVINNGQRNDNLEEIRQQVKQEVRYTDSINLSIEERETAQEIVTELLDDFSGTEDLQAIEDALNTIPQP